MMEEEKPEAMTAPVKKENDNKKKWLKRIWVRLISIFIVAWQYILKLISSESKI
jgi:hypothetical protein